MASISRVNNEDQMSSHNIVSNVQLQKYNVMYPISADKCTLLTTHCVDTVIEAITVEHSIGCNDLNCNAMQLE